MKVAFVSRWGVQCGIATYTDQLVKAIMDQGPDCECAAENLIGIKEISLESRIAFDRCWDGRIGSLDGIFQFLKSTRPQVVHFQHEFGLFDHAKQLINLLGKIKALRIPVVFTCHTVMPAPHEKHWFFRDVLNDAHAIVAHNESTRAALIKGWKHPTNKVHVIPHGTPEECAVGNRMEARKELFLPEDPNLVIAISLGFITPGKMQHEAVQAIVWLVQEGLLDPRKFLYVIAGEPGQNDPGNIEYCRALHNILYEARAWNYIRIISGFVSREKLPVWYGASDFVITGSHETFFSVSGRSHQEMAFGMPSISSNARLLSDLNEKRSLKYTSMPQLRSHILTMIRDPNVRRQLSRRSLEFAEKTSWTNVALKHIELYEQLTGKKAGK